MRRSGFSRVEWSIALVIVFGVLSFCMGFSLPFELLFWLFAGWFIFLGRVLPSVRPDWSTIAMGTVALVMFTVGLHGFLWWLSAAIGKQQKASEQRGSNRVHAEWPWRWTMSIAGIVVFLFTAGIAMVGAAHQVAWMAGSQEPLVNSNFGHSRRMQSSYCLRMIGLATMQYEDTYHELSPGMITGLHGEALHGWQTLLLPYLEQQDLFQSIDRSLPWTDAKHRKAFQTKLRIFQIPHDNIPVLDERGYAVADYSANVHVMGGTKGRKLSSITDGAANTILCGEAGGNYKPWGHPRNWRDPALGINRSPDGFGSPWPNGANIGFVDGHVKFLSNNTDPKVLRALATPAGGEVVPPDAR
jgi:prepilin-type processing-associated H-X9-DG protein